MRRILLDTDTAGDDAIAMLMALRAKDARLDCVTINCGNVDFDQEVENALYTIQVSGMGGKVPVYPGARHPILQEWRTVEQIHGRDGMGNSRLPRARQRPEDTHAVDAIIDTVNSNPGEITIVEIAPMTNLALALRKDPGLAKKVRDFYFMGGTNHSPGNVTPAAEFNIWVDPDAAKIVLSSGMPTTMVGWEICLRYGMIGAREYEEIEATNTPESRFFIAVNRQVRKYTKEQTGIDATSCPDSITMSIVLNPKVATKLRRRYVEVDNSPGISRGATLVDDLGMLGKKPNMSVVYEASHDLYRGMLYRLLRGDQV